MKARSQERSGDQEEWAVLGLSSGKRMVLFKGGGEPVGVTAPDRPAVGVAPSGESVFMFPTIVLPSGRGVRGPRDVLAARTVCWSRVILCTGDFLVSSLHVGDHASTYAIERSG